MLGWLRCFHYGWRWWWWRCLRWLWNRHNGGYWSGYPYLLGPAMLTLTPRTESLTIENILSNLKLLFIGSLNGGRCELQSAMRLPGPIDNLPVTTCGTTPGGVANVLASRLA